MRPLHTYDNQGAKGPRQEVMKLLFVDANKLPGRIALIMACSNQDKKRLVHEKHKLNICTEAILMYMEMEQVDVKNTPHRSPCSVCVQVWASQMI